MSNTQVSVSEYVPVTRLRNIQARLNMSLKCGIGDEYYSDVISGIDELIIYRKALIELGGAIEALDGCCEYEGGCECPSNKSYNGAFPDANEAIKILASDAYTVHKAREQD